jgi:curved DNA-binding protein
MIDLEDAYQGASRSISLRTPELDSTGHVTTRQRTLNVKIPKGVKQGQRIRLAGQGSPGMGKGQSGDLYLEIEFKPHKLFRVEGRDVYLELPVAPWEAALGATVKAPTPAGPVDLKIPAGTTRGRKLRLQKRGIPGQPPGDLFVELSITLPPADSDAARQLYREMQKELVYNPRSKLGV